VAARALDVLEDRRDPRIVSVAEDVDVELDRVLEEAVVEARPFDGELGRVPGDMDAAAADHVMRPDEHGIAELLGRRVRFGGVVRGAPRRRAQAELVEQLREPHAVLGRVDRGERLAEQRYARVVQPRREPQRRLAAERDDDPERLLDMGAY
jgi:hypothetical protein